MWYTVPAKRRCSILVRSAASEEGPKNPLKGIAVKPLVPASYAQFGVGAGWKARDSPALAAVGRSPMAWGSRPCGRGDLFTCMGVLPLWYSDLCTAQVRNLYCGATRPGAVNAVCRCSLPCVGMAYRGPTPFLPGQGGARDRPLKPWLQKRLGGGLTVVENT